jgi:hypothetical protein
MPIRKQAGFKIFESSGSELNGHDEHELMQASISARAVLIPLNVNVGV